MDTFNETPGGARSAENTFEVVVFTLYGGERPELFGINVHKVRELLTYQAPTPLPVAKTLVKGVLKVRDEVVSVFDLAGSLGYPDEQPGLLVLSEFAHQTLGFPVKAVMGIERVSWGQVTPAETVLGSALRGKVMGLARMEDGRLISLLDVEGLVGEHINLVPPMADEPDRLAGSPTVMYVDDSAFARKIVAQVLTAAGAQAIETQDGVQAWERLENAAASHQLPAAVVTDVEMPRMDGLTLTRRIKQDPRTQHIKVLMYSSLSGAAVSSEGLAHGADAYCLKFHGSDLARELRRLLA